MGCIEVSRTLERKKMYTNIIFVGSFPAILYLAMNSGILNERNWTYYLLYYGIVIVALFIINFLYTIIFKKITNKEKEKYNITNVSTCKYALQKCMNSTFVMVYPALLFCSLFPTHLIADISINFS